MSCGYVFSCLSRKAGLKVSQFSKKVVKIYVLPTQFSNKQYSWQLNLRELKNDTNFSGFKVYENVWFDQPLFNTNKKSFFFQLKVRNNLKTQHRHNYSADNGVASLLNILLFMFKFFVLLKKLPILSLGFRSYKKFLRNRDKQSNFLTTWK